MKSVLKALPVAALFLLVTGCAADSGSSGSGEKTEQVTVTAVNAQGAPQDGWTVSPDPAGQVDCSAGTPSDSATTAGVYSCDPVAMHANVCWKGADARTLLCAEDPFTPTLRTMTTTVDLPAVGKPDKAQPWAVQLDDGTQCVLRHGGGWGVGADQAMPVYGCLGAGNEDLAVLQGASDASAVDTSKDAWTVKVGKVGSADAQLPAPTVKNVSKAYFAAAAGQ
ncbi:MAG: hypothetical protein QM774_03255 [Gordonia sp. (in: high G+C Gram-positive bacteria)]|uniref:hypothetical protein n=1 Tax=Gordonia sp. (in: high G+C Gram-positive bacteria) TaxID=84139 RepID=UPI0039E5C89A